MKRVAPRLAVRWAALLHDIGKVPTRSFLPDGRVRFLGHAEAGAELFRREIVPRLALEAPLADAVEFLVRHHLRAGQYEPGWQDSAVRRLGREMAPHLEDLLELGRADVTSQRPGRREAALALIDELAERIQALQAEEARPPLLPPGLGHAIMQRFALTPGPEVGRLRDAVARAVEEGRLPPEQPLEVYLQFLERLVE